MEVLSAGEEYYKPYDYRAYLYDPETNTCITNASKLYDPATGSRPHNGQVPLVGGDKEGAPVGEYTPRVPDTQRHTR